MRFAGFTGLTEITGPADAAKPQTPEPGWWEQFDVLIRSPRDALSELHTHLAAHFDIPFAWAIVDKIDKIAAREGTFVVQPEASAIACLVPEGDRVVVALDLDQPDRHLPAPLSDLARDSLKDPRFFRPRSSTARHPMRRMTTRACQKAPAGQRGSFVSMPLPGKTVPRCFAGAKAGLH